MGYMYDDNTPPKRLRTMAASVLTDAAGVQVAPPDLVPDVEVSANPRAFEPLMHAAPKKPHAVSQLTARCLARRRWHCPTSSVSST